MIKIAIASGKGGTGKTFVATNIFHVLLKNDVNAVLVDCDAEAPNSIAFFETEKSGTFEVTQQVPVIDTNVCTFCGRCHEYCNYNAIFFLPPAKIIQVIEELCHGCGACSVACRDNAITEKPVSLGVVNSYSNNGKPSLIEARMNIGVMSPVSVIKAAIRQINGKAEVVIMDSPPGTSCPFIQTVIQADYVILVTEPTPFGLSDLKQSIETLRTISKKFGVIINRSGVGDNKVHEYLKSEDISLLLEIPFKKEIAGMYAMGKIVAEKDKLFAEEMLAVVDNIIKQNGDSSNQR